MPTLLFRMGGRNFYDTDFEPYTFVATFPILMQAIKDEVRDAYWGNSGTSLLIGTGNKTFTMTNGSGIPPSGFRGRPRVYIRSYAALATNYMVGVVTAFNETTGETTVSVDTVGGAGTFTDWVITFAGENGAAVGATNTPSYLTLAADGGLVNERVWTPGAGVDASDAGAGNAYTVRTKTEPSIASGTTYTQVTGDNQKHKRFTNAAQCAVSGLRANTSAGCPIGTIVGVEAAGGGVLFTPSTGTVNGAASFLFPAGSTGLLISDGADDWRAVITHVAARVIEVTASTFTEDRSHRGALIVLNRSGGVAVTKAQTNDLGIGADFEVEYQAVVGNHTITTAGGPQNVFDKAGGPTVLALREGEGVKQRSNGGSGTAGVWASVRTGLPNGVLVDTVSAAYVTHSTQTAAIAFDDSKPQQSEGTEILTAAITPKAATNKLRVRARGVFSLNGSGGAVVALFRDAAADCVACSVTYITAANNLVEVEVMHEEVAGSTSPTTFKVRVAPVTSVTMYLNGNNAGRQFGGALKWTIELEEFKAA